MLLIIEIKIPSKIRSFVNCEAKPIMEAFSFKKIEKRSDIANKAR